MSSSSFSNAMNWSCLSFASFCSFSTVDLCIFSSAIASAFCASLASSRASASDPVVAVFTVCGVSFDLPLEPGSELTRGVWPALRKVACTVDSDANGYALSLLFELVLDPLELSTLCAAGVIMSKAPPAFGHVLATSFAWVVLPSLLAPVCHMTSKPLNAASMSRCCWSALSASCKSSSNCWTQSASSMTSI